MSRDKFKLRVFKSFEEENDAEIERLALMSYEERLEEFAILQKRVWGDEWTRKPIKKTISYEKIKW